MFKRGQVSVFVIVGIIIVILAALFFFLRSEVGLFVNPTTFLNEKSRPIEDNLKVCVRNVTLTNLNLLAKQGGNLNPTNYVLYQSNPVSFFCNNIPNDRKCLNVMPTFDNLVTNLNAEIQSGVNDCVDKGLVENGFGYEVNAGSIKTELTILGDSVAVKADYDIKIKKGEITQEIRPIVERFDIPIQDLYGVSVDVINSEASLGYFEQLLYMLNERGQFIVNLDKPYPNKIYRVQKKGSDFEFWFAVEGERGDG